MIVKLTIYYLYQYNFKKLSEFQWLLMETYWYHYQLVSRTSPFPPSQSQVRQPSQRGWYVNKGFFYLDVTNWISSFAGVIVDAKGFFWSLSEPLLCGTWKAICRLSVYFLSRMLIFWSILDNVSFILWCRACMRNLTEVFPSLISELSI